MAVHKSGRVDLLVGRVDACQRAEAEAAQQRGPTKLKS
jgi:hypothetical protein